jgi:cytidine deaminase
MDEKQIKLLINHARKAQSFALARYSKFKVGAALLSEDDTIVTGCNVESTSYGLTICAERVALVKALSDGKTKFRAIAVVGPGHAICPPCGACRQLLYDYCPNIDIILTDDNRIKIISLKELLPLAFEENRLIIL